MDRSEYISDEQVVQRVNTAVKLAIEKKKATNTPIVLYDRKEKTIYQLNSDGTKTVIQRHTRGRYSERINEQ